MTGTLARLALAVVLSGPTVSALAPPPAQAAVPRAPSSTCQSLQHLGAGTVERGPFTANAELFGVDFTLPSGAAQGPTTWYLLRLHVRVVLGNGDTGNAMVSAHTNGRAAAQIDLRPSGGGLEWSTVSAAEPARKERSATREAELTMTNFLQRTGVQGGRNRLTFHVEVYDGAVVESVRVYGDTCVESTTRSPELIEVSSRYAPTPARVGEEFTVYVRIRNVGTGPIGEVRLTARPPDGRLVAVGETTRVRADLTGEWIAELRYRAEAAGAYTIRVDVGTAVSPYVGDNQVSVTVREPGPSVLPWVAVGAAVLVAIAGTWLLLRRFARSGVRHRAASSRSRERVRR